MIVPQPAGLVPRSASPLPAQRTLAHAAMQLLPAVRGAALAAAFGLAAELALRVLASRARVVRASRAAPAPVPPLADAPCYESRTIITEWVTVERVRRLP